MGGEGDQAWVQHAAERVVVVCVLGFETGGGGEERKGGGALFGGGGGCSVGGRARAGRVFAGGELSKRALLNAAARTRHTV